MLRLRSWVRAKINGLINPVRPADQRAPKTSTQINGKARRCSPSRNGAHQRMSELRQAWRDPYTWAYLAKHGTSPSEIEGLKKHVARLNARLAAEEKTIAS